MNLGENGFGAEEITRTLGINGFILHTTSSCVRRTLVINGFFALCFLRILHN